MERTVAIEQERDLFQPITERREVKLAATEALIQIAAQPPRVDGGAEIGVRGGDDGHVHARPLARIGAERAHPSVFDDLKELRLDLEREICELVEEEDAGVGCHEGAALVAIGARARAAHGTEELAVGEGSAQRGRVVRDEGSASARPGVVKELRDGGFARAALTEDQERSARLRGVGDLRAKGAHERPEHALGRRIEERRRLRVLTNEREVRIQIGHAEEERRADAEHRAGEGHAPLTVHALAVDVGAMTAREVAHYKGSARSVE